MKIKILTHVNKLDGTRIPDHILIRNGNEYDAYKVKMAVRSGEYNTDNYTVTLRRY